MASWDENSSVQGAASGAAIGTAFAPGIGTAIGGAVGFIAGGIMGGSSKDAAKKAEEARKREIEAAILRQNQSTFAAKSQAEQWSLADIGVGREDTYLEAMDDRGQLGRSASAAVNALDANYQRQGELGQYINNNGFDGLYAKLTMPGVIAAGKESYNQATIATGKYNANEGIINSFNDDAPIIKY